MSNAPAGIGAAYAAQVAQDEAAKAPPSPAPQEAPAQEGAPAAAADGAKFDLGVPEVAELGWNILDVLVCKYAGKELALTADEKARLVPPTVRVLEKYGAAVTLSPEYALLLTAGTIYAAKLLQAGALDFGKPAPAPAAAPSSPSTTTTAAVDGKPVAAEVHQREASA